MKPTKNKIALTVGMMGLIIGVGGSIAAQSHAQSVDAAATETQSVAVTAAPASVDRIKGGHVGANGTKEELLTGDISQKVTAAALTAVPGATIDRVETDAEGAVYEAHMTKSDGSQVTVKFDANYSVAATEDGPMRR